MSKLGIEKIDKIIDTAKFLAVIAKKVTKDNKIDINDLPYAIEIFSKLNQIIECFSYFKHAFSEARDIDVNELISLIKKIDQAIKEIENA